jgi:hypothetical protein
MKLTPKIGLERLLECSLHNIHRLRRVNHNETRIAFRSRKIPIPHALKKGQLLFLKTVEFGTLTSAFDSDTRIKIKQQR